MKLYRQGDVLFRRIFKAPTSGKFLNHGVIARGEKTGHCHRIADLEAAQLFEVEQGHLYMRVTAEGGVAIVHDEHKSLVLPKADYEITKQREYTPTEIRSVQD